ncbi:MAG: hypothetical protein OXC46_02285 [Thaumarchaeota archaeon]|nr:hypothetical protein [Nitrososphaerota archaeon]
MNKVATLVEPFSKDFVNAFRLFKVHLQHTKTVVFADKVNLEATIVHLPYTAVKTLYLKKLIRRL